MNYLIVAISIVLIIYAVVILIRSLVNMSKGKCCEGCEHCPSNDICSSNPENHLDVPAVIHKEGEEKTHE